jgi:hypothetical protein
VFELPSNAEAERVTAQHDTASTFPPTSQLTQAIFHPLLPHTSFSYENPRPKTEERELTLLLVPAAPVSSRGSYLPVLFFAALDRRPLPITPALFLPASW